MNSRCALPRSPNRRMCEGVAQRDARLRRLRQLRNRADQLAGKVGLPSVTHILHRDEMFQRYPAATRQPEATPSPCLRQGKQAGQATHREAGHNSTKKAALPADTLARCGYFAFFFLLLFERWRTCARSVRRGLPYPPASACRYKNGWQFEQISTRSIWPFIVEQV